MMNVLTRGFSNYRNNYNAKESILSAANVNVNMFGKLFARPVKGEIYAGILIVNQVDTPKGIRNVMYVTTTSNNVYAFDADDPDDNEPIWQINLGPNAPISDNQFGNLCTEGTGAFTDFLWEVGIISTPVIDELSQTMFVVAMNKDSSHPFVYKHRLHALDIRTGEAKRAPVIIEGSLAGTGVGNINNRVEFQSAIQLQRTSLTLHQQTIIIAFAAFCDSGPYHGWVFGYDANTFQQKFIWNTSPNQQYGGIWQSGVGAAVDDSGYIYLKTGDGSFDPNEGSFGNTLVKLRIDETSNSLAVVDYFAPKYNQGGDYWDMKADFGSGGCIIPWPGSKILLCGSKHGEFFVVDQDNLGKLNMTADNVIQSWEGAQGWEMGPQVFWSDQDFSYIWTEFDRMKQFKFYRNGNRGLFDTTPYALSSMNAKSGGMIALSSSDNSLENGIVWATHAIENQGTPKPGMLRVFSAKNIATEIYNSNQNEPRDELGYYAKFNQPVPVNGRVYVATFAADSNVNCFATVYGHLKPRIVNMFPNEATLQLNGRSSVSLTVRATGFKGLTYQWYMNNEPMQGQTNQVLEVVNLRSNSNFFCRVTNQYGSTDSKIVAILKQPDIAPQQSNPIPEKSTLIIPSKSSNGTSSITWKSTLLFTLLLFILQLLL